MPIPTFPLSPLGCQWMPVICCRAPSRTLDVVVRLLLHGTCWGCLACCWAVRGASLDPLQTKAARLRRPARAGGQGPPPLLVSATAPAAPTRSARSNAEADSQTRKQRDHSEHQGQADTDQVRARHPTSPAPQPNRPQRCKQSPAVRPLPLHRPGRDEDEAVTNGRSVAETGGWLLEAHVTGVRSTHPPSWLTFGGSGQDPLQLDNVELGLR